MIVLIVLLQQCRIVAKSGRSCQLLIIFYLATAARFPQSKARSETAHSVHQQRVAVPICTKQRPSKLLVLSRQILQSCNCIVKMGTRIQQGTVIDPLLRILLLRCTLLLVPLNGSLSSFEDDCINSINVGVAYRTSELVQQQLLPAFHTYDR